MVPPHPSPVGHFTESCQGQVDLWVWLTGAYAFHQRAQTIWAGLHKHAPALGVGKVHQLRKRALRRTGVVGARDAAG